MKFFKKRKFLTGLAIVFLILLILYLNAGPLSQKTQYGVTFSPEQSKSLGLNWQANYLAMLDDLKIRDIRLSAYWDQVEPKQDKYDFSELDFLLSEAQKRNARVVLSVGRRLPRWPECHDPDWIKGLDQSQLKNSLLSFIETAVTRYQNNPAVRVWQVENEPFLASFGECPKPDAALLDSEIALVKKLDPSRPILVSDSGELSLWLNAGKRGDIFGTTLYRYVFSDVFKRYWVNYIPFWFYRLKAGFLRFLYPGKQVVIIELQAEPWTTKGITSTPIDEQFKTMSLDKFHTILNVAKSTGFSPQYLWGVEWWYWMKEKQGHPEFWDAARQLFAQN